MRCEAERSRADAVLATSAADPAARAEVRSPTRGRVLAIARRGPEVVGAGAPLLEVGDLARMELVVGLLTRDAVVVAERGEATIGAWGGPPFRARVRRVEPSGYAKLSALGVDEQRVDVVLDPVEPSALPASLGDGFRIEVSLTTFSTPDALCVPAGAVFRHGDGWASFLVEDGRARLRPVTVGERSERDVEVLGGLGAEDRVVLHPGDRVKDGVRVREVEVAR